ncbi:MAG: hypothetical protein OEQ53_02050 [Saprospiraceae bacterium]|nr:hypothetical protein [Saprospiraceae bacterium]
MKYMLILGLFAMASCSKDDIDDPEVVEISWILGAEHTGDTTVRVPAPGDGFAQLIVSDYSICPNQQITITVTSEDDQEITKFQADSLLERDFMVDANGDLLIRSHLSPTSKDIVCVWLGQAKLTYRADK